MNSENQRQRLEEQRFEDQRIEDQRIEDQQLDEQRLEDQRLEDQRLEDQRLEDQRLEDQRLEDQRLEDQRLEDQRLEDQRLEDQRQQQHARAPKRRKEQGRKLQQQDLEGEAAYAEMKENLNKEAGKQKGLDRHDLYNIESAHELEDAMVRAHQQGIDPANQKQFQKFLDREKKQGINQEEGKRPLAERYQELSQRRDEAISLRGRGVSTDLIPSTQLYESGWEQQYRLNKEPQRTITPDSLRLKVEEQQQRFQYREPDQSQEKSQGIER